MNNIALLATGDEVVEGEILNSNAQKIAQILTEQGYAVDTHFSCRDGEETIFKAIDNLLTSHGVLIITGGLGPTSDDLTRYALNRYLNSELVFNNSTWQWITSRYAQLNLPVPETNRQQAYFPQNAVILNNQYGSADGCFVEHKQKLIFMLPGPPNECMPIIYNDVINRLHQHIQNHRLKLLRWRVFNISESKLAEDINHLCPAISKHIGYRWHFPYIDVKYRPKTENGNDENVNKLTDFLANYTICANNSSACEELKKFITDNDVSIYIQDEVTGGRLQTKIHDPSTTKSLSFSNPNKTIQIYLTGLETYWHQRTKPSSTTISVKFVNKQNSSEHQYSAPNRQVKLTWYATELIAYKIHQFLRGNL